MLKIFFPEAIHLLFLLVFILRVLTQSIASNTCQEKSQWEFALEHPHFKSLSTNDYPECLLHCLYDKARCRSLTYDSMAKICKLNSETRWSKPSQYVKKSYNIYMEMIGRESKEKEAGGAGKAHTADPISSQRTSIQTKIAFSRQVSNYAKTTFPTTLPTIQSTSSLTASVQGQTSSTAPLTTVHSMVSVTDHLLSTQPISSQVAEAQTSSIVVPLSVMPTSSQSTVMMTEGTNTASASIAPQQFDLSSYCSGKANGDYIHPTDCKQYITCSNGYAHERFCNNIIGPVCLSGC